MSIVCAVDFSEHSAQAAAAAAALAAVLREPLALVHAVPTYGWMTQRPQIQAPMLQAVEEMLGQETDRLRRMGITVTAELLNGIPDEVIVEYARASGARLVVASALGYRSEGTGSIADRIAQTSPVPALIVRRSEPFQAWQRVERPLQVLIAMDLSTPSYAAAQWVGQLRQAAPCDVLVVHVYWQLAEKLQDDTGATEVEPLDPSTEQALIRDLAARIGDLPGEGTLRFRILAGRDLIADQLVEFAEQVGGDLIVLGTHQRTGLGRWWYGSVSQAALHAVSTNVVCVPLGLVEELVDDAKPEKGR